MRVRNGVLFEVELMRKQFAIALGRWDTNLYCEKEELFMCMCVRCERTLQIRKCWADCCPIMQRANVQSVYSAVRALCKYLHRFCLLIKLVYWLIYGQLRMSELIGHAWACVWPISIHKVRNLTISSFFNSGKKETICSMRPTYEKFWMKSGWKL